jgi:hypothetical protein
MKQCELLLNHVSMEPGVVHSVYLLASRSLVVRSKSLVRMFGPKGNLQASNLFAVIHNLQEQEGIHLEVKARKVT